MDFPSTFDFGVYVGAILDGVSPERVPYLTGLAKVAASPSADVMNRLVLRVTADMMEQCGYAGKAPTLHLKMAAEDRSERFIEHRRELVALVTGSLRRFEPLQKEASSLSAIGQALLVALKGAGLAAAGTGALGGAGVWKVKHEMDTADLPIKAQQASADYYDQLTHDLNDRLKRRYEYSGTGGANAKSEGQERRRLAEVRPWVDRARRLHEQTNSPSLQLQGALAS